MPSRSGSSASAIQGQLSALGWVRLQGEPQHRSLRRLGVDDQLDELRHDDIEAIGCVCRRILGQQRAHAGLRVCREDEGPLVREVAVGRGAGDPRVLGRLLYRGFAAGSNQLAGRIDECLTGAPLLVDAPGGLVGH
jgi:hypothetical protein